MPPQLPGVPSLYNAIQLAKSVTQTLAPLHSIMQSSRSIPHILDERLGPLPLHNPDRRFPDFLPTPNPLPHKPCLRHPTTPPHPPSDQYCGEVVGGESEAVPKEFRRQGNRFLTDRSADPIHVHVHCYVEPRRLWEWRSPSVFGHPSGPRPSSL